MWKCGSILSHPLEKSFFSKITITKVPMAGITFFFPKEPVDSSEWPENRKLRLIEKQPTYNFKPPKMFKMIKLMRGPEPVHYELIYNGYGVKVKDICALLGGRLMFHHFETVRRHVNKKIDVDRMFAVWRVDDPWQPLAKRSTGKKLGGGKGSIHHYCTPVKANRIIMELAGDIHEIEARKILTTVVAVLPFPSRVVSKKDLDEEKKNEEWVSKNNINPYDMEYVINNNMGGCRRMLSKYDYEWLGKYK